MEPKTEWKQTKCVIQSGIIELKVPINADTFLYKDGSFVISLIGEDHIRSFKEWINNCLDKALDT